MPVTLPRGCGIGPILRARPCRWLQLLTRFAAAMPGGRVSRRSAHDERHPAWDAHSAWFTTWQVPGKCSRRPLATARDKCKDATVDVRSRTPGQYNISVISYVPTMGRYRLWTTKAGPTQADVVKAARQSVSFVRKYESGERRLHLLDLMYAPRSPRRWLISEALCGTSIVIAAQQSINAVRQRCALSLRTSALGRTDPPLLARNDPAL
jgi:hypothetical protein